MDWVIKSSDVTSELLKGQNTQFMVTSICFSESDPAFVADKLRRDMSWFAFFSCLNNIQL